VDVSIHNGSSFKAVLGMKTALKVVIIPMDGGIQANASVGIFGQQAIPTVISMLFLWPVLITQIWGLIRQSKLDDLALDTIGEALSSPGGGPTSPVGEAKKTARRASLSEASHSVAYCPNCGKPIPPSAKFCPACGFKL
jgi:ribosomal protein L32